MASRPVTVISTVLSDMFAGNSCSLEPVCEVPVASVAVMRRLNVSVSVKPRRPVAAVLRLRVMEVGVEEKRVGVRGTAGTPEMGETH